MLIEIKLSLINERIKYKNELSNCQKRENESKLKAKTMVVTKEALNPWQKKIRGKQKWETHSFNFRSLEFFTRATNGSLIIATTKQYLDMVLFHLTVCI